MMPTKHYINMSPENIVEEIDGVVYTEEWRSVIGYKGLYEVSSFGRIRCCARTDRIGHFRPSKIMKQFITRRGYLRICLTKKSGAQTKYHVHQLVGKAYIKNPKRKKTVNHKHGYKLFNFINELEWNTHSENIKHAFRVLGKKPSGPPGKRVFQLSLCGDLINIFNSYRSAAKEVKRTPPAIRRAVLLKTKSAGYYWKLKL